MYGRIAVVAEERFTVRADTVDGLRLSTHGFEVEQLYGAYDVDRPHAAEDAMIVAVARADDEGPRRAVP